jgi:penicillin-binding protein 2
VYNRPHSTFDELDADRDPSRAVDDRPLYRLLCLIALLCVPFAAVGYRLYVLQVRLGEGIVDHLDVTTESFEPIPSRDGRILGSDGRVLAEDVRRFRILAHYRWLEDPPDSTWLRRRALGQLDRRARRDAQRIAEAEARVIAERDAMWSRLAELSDTSPAEIAARRGRVVERVERIIASVERRRAGRNDGSSSEGDSLALRPWWQRLHDAIVTPPERESVEPLIVQEELEYHVVVDGVSIETAAVVEAEPDRFPGLRIDVDTERTYPAGSLAAHVVGHRRTAAAEDVAARRAAFPAGDPLDYRVGDSLGSTGIERAYDRQLHGTVGTRRLLRDRHGEIVASEVVRRPRVGRDVVLVLHPELQNRCERLLDDALEHGVDSEEGTPIVPPGGAIVVLDVHTGAVLVAASAPRFDLGELSDPDPDRWQALLDDPRRPFFPRATRMTIAPGSVFKTLTAVALLEEGRLDPEALFACQGFLDSPGQHRCYVYTHFGRGHGNVDLGDALAQSCNVYFFAAARDLGPRALVMWAERFGFGRPTGIDEPGEVGGHLPSPDRTADGERWYGGDTLGLAIGQSRLTVTPLQVARLMAAIANGGSLVTPHVVRRLERPGELASIVDPPPAHEIPGLRPVTLEHVRRGLTKVVNDPSGTGYKRVRLDTVTIAGKTGTAETGRDTADHAWFAGYVPAEEPRYAICVVLEHAGSGGLAGGPIARRVVQEMLAVELLQGR